jgi:hypothetical protein
MDCINSSKLLADNIVYDREAKGRSREVSGR